MQEGCLFMHSEHETSPPYSSFVEPGTDYLYNLERGTEGHSTNQDRPALTMHPSWPKILFAASSIYRLHVQVCTRSTCTLLVRSSLLEVSFTC